MGRAERAERRFAGSAGLDAVQVAGDEAPALEFQVAGFAHAVSGIGLASLRIDGALDVVLILIAGDLASLGFGDDGVIGQVGPIAQWH